MDCFLWQTLASVVLPGYVINVITSGAGKMMRQVVPEPAIPPNITQPLSVAKSISTSIPKILRVYGPTAMGLAAIPLIIRPIDEAVHYLMDQTFRTLGK